MIRLTQSKLFNKEPLNYEGFFIFITMKNNIWKILGIILLIVLILILILTTKKEDKPFNQIELSYRNTITNTASPSYYDTILSVGMDQMNISGYSVLVNKLSDNAKSQFDGELSAHIRYVNSNFYLFIDDMDRKDAIDVISHEIIHMQQYISGDLIYNKDGNVNWKGEIIDLKSSEYDKRPWESDAFSRQIKLSNSIEKIILSNN